MRLEVWWDGARGRAARAALDADEPPLVLQTSDGAGAFAAVAGTHYQRVDDHVAITRHQVRAHSLR